MPTGYTAAVCDGKVTFNQFVWHCARAFGPLIMMRDEASDAVIPEKLPGTGDYNVESLAKAKKRLADIKKMSLATAAQRAQTDYDEAVAARDKHIKEVTETRERLDAMRAQVADWAPPTNDHNGLKKFMIEQLDETIRFDGTVSEYYTKIEKKSPEEWLESARASAQRDIDYHTRELAEAQQRDAERQQWVDELRSSVPYEAPNSRE